MVEWENTIILILVGNRIKTPSTEPFVMSCWHEGNLRNNVQTCHLKCVGKEATVFPSLTHVPLSWLDQCAHSCTPFTPPHPWPRGRHLNWQQSMLETGLSSPGRWCESSRRSIPNLGPPPSKHPPLSGHVHKSSTYYEHEDSLLKDTWKSFQNSDGLSFDFHLHDQINRILLHPPHLYHCYSSRCRRHWPKFKGGSKSLTTGSNFFPTPQEDSFGAVLCLLCKATRGDERNVYFSTLRTEKTIIGQRRDIKYWHWHHHGQRGAFLMNGKLAPALKLDTRVTTFTAKGGISLYTEQRREKWEEFTTISISGNAVFEKQSPNPRLVQFSLERPAGLLLGLWVILRVVVPSLLASVVHLLVPVRVSRVLPRALFHAARPVPRNWNKLNKLQGSYTEVWKIMSPLISTLMSMRKFCFKSNV